MILQKQPVSSLFFSFFPYRQAHKEVPYKRSKQQEEKRSKITMETVVFSTKRAGWQDILPAGPFFPLLRP